MASFASFNEIAASIQNTILTSIPNANVLANSVISDVFINPQAFELETLTVLAYNASLAQSLLTASGNALDYLAANFGIQRNQAQYATGNVTFFTYDPVPQVISIPSGTLVQTGSGGGSSIVLQFVTTQNAFIAVGSSSVTVPVICTVPGSIGNVSVGAINTLSTANIPINGIINNLPTSGGENEEIDESLSLRAQLALSGGNVGTEGAYRSVILNNISTVVDAQVLPPSNILSRGPGKVDIYIQNSSSFQSASSSQIVPAGSTGVTIGQNLVILQNQPVTSITSIIVNNQVVSPTEYSLVFDTSDYANSSLAQNSLIWNVPAPSQQYTINYTYNSNVQLAQQAIIPKTPIGSDVLVKQATAVNIYISAFVTLFSFADQTTVLNSILTSFQNYFSNKRLNQDLYETDIICLITSVPGVASVQTPLANFSRDSFTNTSINTIDIATLEYAVLAPTTTTQPNPIITFNSQLVTNTNLGIDIGLL
jgi:uncharacterized phage protein gp47/JayE